MAKASFSCIGARSKQVHLTRLALISHKSPVFCGEDEDEDEERMNADEFLWAWVRWWYRSDYTAIDPRYGTLEDWDRLLAGVHERGMKLLYVLSPFSLLTAQYKRLTELYSNVERRCRMDLVANHTSDEVRLSPPSRSPLPSSIPSHTQHFNTPTQPTARIVQRILLIT